MVTIGWHAGFRLLACAKDLPSFAARRNAKMAPQAVGIAIATQCRRAYQPRRFHPSHPASRSVA